MLDNSFNVKAKPKSDKEAEEFRAIGNQWFKKKAWFQALENYNKSILFAESKSIASLSYANRSAVYLEIGRFRDCLENIDLATENDYPTVKMNTLVKRAITCKLAMIQFKDHVVDPWDVFQLSYPANENIPWIVNCVEVRHTQKYGRGVYATRDLKAGDVICIEELAFTYTDDRDIYMRCYNCAKVNGMNLIPCDQTASMMFCSVQCKDNFNLKAFNKDKMKSADVKMLADIADAFGSVQNVDEFVHAMNSSVPKKTIFDFDFSNPNDPDYKKNLMTCLLSLASNDCRINGSRYIREFVSDKTAQHIQSIYNVNQKQWICGFGHDIEDVPCKLDYGHDIGLFASLINHSCFMNAFSVIIDNKVMTIMNKPIKKGEQIFIKYFHGKIIGIEELDQLKNVHKFTCDCEMCANKEQMFRVLVSTLPQIKLDVRFTNVAQDAARSMDPQKMKDLMKSVWKNINDDPTYPKIQYTIYMEATSFLTTIISFLSYQFI